jgi:3-isopropylmalate dehydratase small subunit
MKRQPFQNFDGIAAPLPRKNINTDAIIPAPYLRTADADLAAGLFALWRYDDAGRPIPDFILNQPGFERSTILLGGENFGCGSSREAAAWALVRFGIKAVFAPSFADIFYENAFRNGLLAGVIDSEDLAKLVASIGTRAEQAHCAVDLEAATLSDANGRLIAFSVPDFRREALLRGDDDIATTLRHSEEIHSYIKADSAQRPWIYETGLEPS